MCGFHPIRVIRVPPPDRRPLLTQTGAGTALRDTPGRLGQAFQQPDAPARRRDLNNYNLIKTMTMSMPVMLLPSAPYFE
jgi:hypothetical protein